MKPNFLKLAKMGREVGKGSNRYSLLAKRLRTGRGVSKRRTATLGPRKLETLNVVKKEK